MISIYRVHNLRENSRAFLRSCETRIRRDIARLIARFLDAARLEISFVGSLQNGARISQIRQDTCDTEIGRARVSLIL